MVVITVTDIVAQLVMIVRMMTQPYWSPVLHYQSCYHYYLY